METLHPQNLKLQDEQNRLSIVRASSCGEKRIDIQADETTGRSLSSTRKQSRRLDFESQIRDPINLNQVGKADFYWWRDLSENGQKLYICLLEERGDRDLLPVYAIEEQFDLKLAINELRSQNVLDDSNSSQMKLK